VIEMGYTAGISIRSSEAAQMVQLWEVMQQMEASTTGRQLVVIHNKISWYK
jgi:hypothetical protein